jgi:chromosome segregation ATPase
MLTPRIPRRKGLITGYSSFNMGREHTNSYMHNDALKAKEKEIDVLARKLNRCENLIQAKDERIQELEELVEKLKSNRSSS